MYLSQDLRQLLIISGFKLPTSANTIRQQVINYSLNIRKLISKEIVQCKDRGARFSLSFHEWTTTSNKRYVNISVHSPKEQWNLGLISVNRYCIEVLQTRLSEYSLSIDTDIVAMVTDSGNRMVPVGKLEQQFCLVHGIHLAVCDVLYKKCPAQFSEAPLEETDMDTAEDDENEDMGLSFVPSTYDESVIHFEEQNIENLVSKVRKIVVLFKRSPADLQKYVKASNGEEFSLMLDCKTRWDSLLSMLKRFFDLKPCIVKALIDLECPISLEENDFVSISEIVEVLEPIKLAVDALCRRDANLCTADAVLVFLFRQILENPSHFASKMFQALKASVEKRRHVELSGVLQNPKYTDETSVGKLFGVPPRSVIEKQIKKLIERRAGLNKASLEEVVDQREESPIGAGLSLKDKLQEEIAKSMKTHEPKTQTSN